MADMNNQTPHIYAYTAIFGSGILMQDKLMDSINSYRSICLAYFHCYFFVPRWEDKNPVACTLF